MTHAEAIRALLEPALPDYVWQFGRWEDNAEPSRYAVLRPAGGVGAGLLRQPQFTLSLVGLRAGDAFTIAEAANFVVETCRAASGDLVYVDAGEPVYTPTADGRPIFEIALGVIAT